jgi:hypothetical protein
VEWSTSDYAEHCPGEHWKIQLRNQSGYFVGRQFSGIYLLPETKDELSPEKLYVGTLTEVMQLRQDDSSILLYLPP